LLGVVSRLPRPVPAQDRAKPSGRIMLCRSPLLCAGNTRASYAGYSSCRFADCHDPGREHLGTRDLTDGDWIWPEGLAHYVTEHAVRLPDEFVAAVAARDYAIGAREAQDASLEPDPSFWLRWSAANTPPPAPGTIRPLLRPITSATQPS
jgi:hypothetical protein